MEAPLGKRVDPGDQLAATLEWATQRLGQPLPVPALAARSSLSPRQFTRRFREATGTTPHRWLLTQRLALAQRLLETTGLPVDQVAANAGFGTPAALRLQFRQSTRPPARQRTGRPSAPPPRLADKRHRHVRNCPGLATAGRPGQCVSGQLTFSALLSSRNWVFPPLTSVAVN